MWAFFIKKFLGVSVGNPEGIFEESSEKFSKESLHDFLKLRNINISENQNTMEKLKKFPKFWKSSMIYFWTNSSGNF